MFSFGNPQQPQQQQQQQPAASNLFSSPGPLSVRDLGSQQQQQQPQPGSLFGQAPQQSLTSTAPNNANNLNPNATAGSGLFSSQPSFGQQSQPQQQQPQQQPQQQTLFSGFTASQPQNAGFLQSQLASSSLSGPQNGSGSTFGNSQLGQSQFGGGSQQPFNTFQPQQGANPGPIQSQQQGSSVSAPQQNQPQQPMSYVPGYLSKIRGGDRPYSSPQRTNEPPSPPHAHADQSLNFGTPNSRSSRDEGGASRGQASPRERFSSSFFNPSGSSGAERAGSVGPGGLGGWNGRESIFGARGLRGSRRTPAPSSGAAPGSSLSLGRAGRAPSSPPRPSLLGGGAEDDDDAPPQEGLNDLSSSSISPPSHPGAGASFGQFGSSLAASTSRVSFSQRLEDDSLGSDVGRRNPFVASGRITPVGTGGSVGVSGGASSDLIETRVGEVRSSDLTQRTVLVYGFPAWMEKPVLDLFTSIGGLEGAEAVDLGGGRSLSTGVAPQGLQQQQQEHQHQQPPEAPCIARLTYSAPYQALRAIRRNGEIVSGACIVGVRWEDDNLHQISLTGGIDAPFFGGGPITSSPSLSSNLGQVGINGGETPNGGGSSRGSGVGGVGKVSHGDGVGVGGPAPTFGRPISIIGTPSSILATKPSKGGGPSAGVGSGGMSPFRGVSLFGSSSSNAGGGGGGGFLMGSKDPSEIIAKKAGRGDGKQANNPTSSSTKEPSSQGFVGRIADGIFGW